MKYTALFALLIFSFFTMAAATESLNSDTQSQQFQDVQNFRWNHGSEPCKSDKNPAIQVMQANSSTYILRQNKCITYEAPFIYVLFGSNKVLVVDTGANESPEESPIYQTVKSLIEKQSGASESGSENVQEILVVHSHSHGDHTKGDSQFQDKEGVVVVGTSNDDLATQLGLTDWPNVSNSIDLGGRVVTYIPIPGHQDQSIAIYDDQTQWLLTGDTLYPGVIRVGDWAAFRDSIKRLHEFSQTKPIKLMLGTHIEWNAKTNQAYEIGSTYQPNESFLPLEVNQLTALNEALQENAEEKELTFDAFLISPLNRFEKILNSIFN